MPKITRDKALWRFLVAENRKEIQQMKDAIKNREVKDKDYPQVAIACEYGGYQAYGHSEKCHQSIRKKLKYVQPLKNALSVYGNPPTRNKLSDGSMQFVGTCAEDYASNQILERYHESTNVYPNLKNLTFTLPIRPRTYQWRKFCDVCRAIF